MHHCGHSVHQGSQRGEKWRGREATENANKSEAASLESLGVDEGPKAAAACIMEQVGSNNSGHWWVATQDKILREDLSKVPGLPVLFATVNGIHLETPSEMTKVAAKKTQHEVMELPEHERTSKALKDLEEIRPQLRTNVKFRKNRAKGPNPLASKKKINKKPQGDSSRGGQEHASKRKRSRNRKHIVSPTSNEG